MKNPMTNDQEGAPVDDSEDRGSAPETVLMQRGEIVKEFPAHKKEIRLIQGWIIVE